MPKRKRSRYKNNYQLVDDFDSEKDIQIEDRASQAFIELTRALRNVEDEEIEDVMKKVIAFLVAQGYSKMYQEMYHILVNTHGIDISDHPTIRSKMIKSGQVMNDLYSECPLDVHSAIKYIKI